MSFLITNTLVGWLLNKEGALFQKSEIKRFNLSEFNYDNVEAVIAFNDPSDRGTDAVSMPIGCLVADRIYITDWYFSKANMVKKQYLKYPIFNEKII